MGVLTELVALVCAAASLQDAPGAASPWRDTWSDLGRISAASRSSTEFQRTWRELDGQQIRRERSARRKGDRVEGFRALVLRAHLSRLAGVPWNEVPELDAPIEFLSGEAGVAVQVAGPGATRVRALAQALREAPESELPPLVARGLEIVDEDASALRLEWALEQATALDERAHDTRTTVRRARVLSLRGEHDRAVELLSRRVESASDAGARAELFRELGRAQTAAGELDASWGSLGGALSLGSRDAGLDLGRRALAAAEFPRARVLFRALLEEDPAFAPARRGYGLALLGGRAPIPESAATAPESQAR